MDDIKDRLDGLGQVKAQHHLAHDMAHDVRSTCSAVGDGGSDGAARDGSGTRCSRPSRSQTRLAASSGLSQRGSE